MNILVVENDPLHQKLAHYILSSAGHTVSEASGTEEALVSIKVKQPQMILLDLHMSGMPTLDFVRILKSDPYTQDIIIVALTALPEYFTKKDFMSAGCEGYIRKPMDTRKLSAQLITIFDQFSARLYKDIPVVGVARMWQKT